MPVEDKIIQRIDELLKKSEKVATTAKVVTTAKLRLNPPNGINDLLVHPGVFTGWRTQVLNFLINLLGNNHVYTQNFEKEVKNAYLRDVGRGQGILLAVREDILGGYLDIRTLISAEVIADFLEMAEHLLKNGYKDPAASLCGAVLENGLRRIASKAEIPIKSRDDLNSLNQKCADKGIYNRLAQKKIQVWIDIRNNAAHGKFTEYSEQDVKEMCDGVRQFLSDYLQ